MKKALNQDGFTILEVLIGSAILLVAMWSLADMLVLNAKGQRNATTESEINALFDQVQSIAGAEWSCTASLKGSVYNQTIIVKDPVNPVNTVATQGTAPNHFWSVSSVQMQNVTAVPNQPGVYRGSLYIKASKNMALNLGAATLSRSVQDIYFEINPDNTIARCYTTSDTVAAAQSACQLIGGTWNSGASNCQVAAAQGS